MKILVTGGHFSPAYAVLQKIKQSNEILVVGRRFAFEGDSTETFEYRICKKEQIPFKIIETGRLQRKLTSYTIPSFIKFPKGVIQAFRILKEFRPNVVVTFGGYVGLPVAIAAKSLGIPIVLHEQTQKAGLSSKAISKIANTICISFESSKKYFSKNTVLTGNPIREEILKEYPIPSSVNKPFLFITGGSTGSHAINEAMYSILPHLLKDFTVVHQTGNSQEFNDYEKLAKLKSELSTDYSKRYIVQEFFNPQEVGAFMQHAHVVISRSGINTVLELMALGVVSILIPLPYGQRNEQKDNAILFEKVGLGVMMEQDSMTPEALLGQIHAIIKDREKFASNKVKAKTYIYENATDLIIQQIYKFQ